MPTIFLGIAAFLIHVVLSRLVSTQRNIIGLLKAFGYSNADRWDSLSEICRSCCFTRHRGRRSGWESGWAVDWPACTRGFSRFPELRFIAGPKLIAWSIAISGLAACLGALTSLRVVIALPPAEAMRPESPPQFREGIAERLGLVRAISISTRMILRNLERRPWKAILTIVGMSFAVAILIVGFYFFDAIDYLVQVQFRTAQRDDVTISLSEPHGEQARYDVNHLVGVLHSEPFRVVPARLRFGHRTKTNRASGAGTQCRTSTSRGPQFRRGSYSGGGHASHYKAR